MRMYNSLILVFVFALQGCMVETGEFVQPLVGMLRGGDCAIPDAIIEVFAVDPKTGEVNYDYILGQGVSDRDGSYYIEISTSHELLLATAREGYTQEYWSNETIMLPTTGHTFALIPYYKEGFAGEHGHPVTMNPWTSVAYRFAQARYKHGTDGDFVNAYENSHRMLYEHLIGKAARLDICDSHLTCLRPVAGNMDEAGRFHVTSTALSSLAYEQAIAGSYVPAEKNAIVLANALGADVLEDGVFNGWHEEQLTENAIRVDLVDAVTDSFLNTDMNTQMIDAEVYKKHFERMSRNKNPEMFGRRSLSTESQ